MFTKETPSGRIYVSNEYFSKLIGNAVSSCYGVAGMVPHGKQKLFNLFNKAAHDKGVIVRGSLQSITVDLHICVTYGVNISAISDSIVNKVKFTVEQATGIQVDKVTIKIDSIKTN